MGVRRDLSGIMPIPRMEKKTVEHSVTFGVHRFDVESGRLWSGTTELRLTPKASAVLKMLVIHAGKPVTKEDLFASVWNGTVVGDDALTSCIQELRKALDDDARQPRFIETRHRRGYQFVAALTDVNADAAARSRPPGNDISAIAVLPFADMSPGRDQDYLCEGLADELINALTRIDGLRVAARTASFQFRDAGADVHAIGQQLGVGTLLEGSVRKSGDRLRVTVQLIEVATGYHRWSQRFDRALDDVFAIQDEIAESVAHSLCGSILSQREKLALLRPHTGAAAYEYYLRGLQHLPRMARGDLEKSAEMFERAIEQDANYSPAFAGLAMVHSTLYEWFGAGEDDLAIARRATQRALELTPDLAEAHVARGFALSLSRHYEEAAKEFEIAIRLNRNLFDAYYYFARSSFACGEVEKSAEMFSKAAEVRREDFQSPLLLGLCLRTLGREDEARKVTGEGIQRAEHALRLNPIDGRALSLGSCALMSDGQTARAMEWSNRSLELYPDDMSTLINGACLHAKSGNKEKALELLERIFEHGCGKRDWVERDPDYESLRGDPRFQKLLAKLK